MGRVVVAAAGAAAAASILTWLWATSARCKQHDAFACPPLISGLSRSTFQLWQRIKIQWTSPAEPSLIAAVRTRAAENDACAARVTVECRCGACRVTVRNGGPIFTTVCHCSLCRAHNRPERVAMPFAAVRRAACCLEIEEAQVDDAAAVQRALKGRGGPSATQDTRHFPLVWLQTSSLVRRGRCALCDTPLLFDQEWFEPATMWIVNPRVSCNSVAGGSGGATQTAAAFLGGQHDADVCWGSRHVPPPADVLSAQASFGDFFSTQPSNDGARGASDSEQSSYPAPRGREQWHDLEWGRYVIDVGRL